MAEANSYRELTVWQRAMELAEAVYRLTSSFPKQEEYRLTSQIIRAAISVPANIAEGQRRATRKEYARFLSIAHGSVAEVETFLLLAERLRFGSTEQVQMAQGLADQISRMLNAMHRKMADQG